MDSDWEVQVPPRGRLHDVRSLRVSRNLLRNEYVQTVRWYSGIGWMAEGDAIRYMYEDAAFDLQGFLDDLHRKLIDALGWCDWIWVE